MDVGRPALRPPGTLAAARKPAVCRCRGRRPRRPAEVGGGGRCTGGMNPSPTGYLLAGVGRKVAEGSRLLPTGQKIKGWQWRGCGPGMPGPYGLPQMGYGREGRGRAAAHPFAVGGWLPGNGRPRKARQSPSGLASSASSPDGAPFCAGGARGKSLPCQREVPSASEAEGFPAVCGCNGQSGKARRNPPVT